MAALQGRGDPNVSSGSELWPTRRDVLKKFYNAAMSQSPHL